MSMRVNRQKEIGGRPVGRIMDDLHSILAKYGFRFKKQFGQNFISDSNLLRSIVASSGITSETTVVEIGCGAGTLTRALAETAKKVYAFDIDADLQPVLAETLAGLDNVEVIFRDFNKIDLPAFEEEIGEYTVVANLPYYITTPLVTKLLEEGKKARGLSIMVQEEVAERFCAKENTPEYGSITAAIALKGSAKIVKRVSRNLFYPRPNVDSAVVKIDFEKDRIPVKDEGMYRSTVRCAFLNRRKTLENNLVNSFGFSRETAKEICRKPESGKRLEEKRFRPNGLRNFPIF